jgi:hypothetical protein
MIAVGNICCPYKNSTQIDYIHYVHILIVRT